MRQGREGGKEEGGRGEGAAWLVCLLPAVEQDLLRGPDIGVRQRLRAGLGPCAAQRSAQEPGLPPESTRHPAPAPRRAAAARRPAAHHLGGHGAPAAQSGHAQPVAQLPGAGHRPRLWQRQLHAAAGECRRLGAQRRLPAALPPAALSKPGQQQLCGCVPAGGREGRAGRRASERAGGRRGRAVGSAGKGKQGLRPGHAGCGAQAAAIWAQHSVALGRPVPGRGAAPPRCRTRVLQNLLLPGPAPACAPCRVAAGDLGPAVRLYRAEAAQPGEHGPHGWAGRCRAGAGAPSCFLAWLGGWLAGCVMVLAPEGLSGQPGPPPLTRLLPRAHRSKVQRAGSRPAPAPRSQRRLGWSRCAGALPASWGARGSFKSLVELQLQWNNLGDPDNRGGGRRGPGPGRARVLGGECRVGVGRQGRQSLQRTLLRRATIRPPVRWPAQPLLPEPPPTASMLLCFRPPPPPPQGCRPRGSARYRRARSPPSRPWCCSTGTTTSAERPPPTTRSCKGVSEPLPSRRCSEALLCALCALCRRSMRAAWWELWGPGVAGPQSSCGLPYGDKKGNDPDLSGKRCLYLCWHRCWYRPGVWDRPPRCLISLSLPLLPQMPGTWSRMLWGGSTRPAGRGGRANPWRRAAGGWPAQWAAGPWGCRPPQGSLTSLHSLTTCVHK